jgi:gas vesicle protein
MDTLLARDEEKRGLNKIFLVGILIGLAAIGAAVYLLSLRPSIEEQTNSILAGAIREGTPEFAELSKDIIISTDDRTVESPTGMGTISMFINGKIRNKGDRTIDILEISVVVVTQFNQVLRERRILVVPVQQALLEPGQTIPVTLTMDGFSKNDDRANIHWKVTAVHAK